MTSPSDYLMTTSQDIIRTGQAETGAYVASPNFSQYSYSWLRDGTWIAHGMAASGDTTSADAFHRWAIRTLEQYAPRVEAALEKRANRLPLDDSELLPTRFQLDGSLGVEAWGDFQLDGYGAWLWGFAQYCQNAQHPLWQTGRSVVKMLVGYLDAFWQAANYDCWEEARDQIHTATLAAIYGGVQAVQQIDPVLVPEILPDVIRTFILTQCISADGHFQKSIGNDAVDSSLLWCAVPFRVVALTDPIFTTTLAKIERDLCSPTGGVYRYRMDTYFGGGEWVLLTAWLGWVYADLERNVEACAILRWVEAQTNNEGELPEQTHNHLLDPDYYSVWVEKWGAPAVPLLWSHGMYLILNARLKGRC